MLDGDAGRFPSELARLVDEKWRESNLNQEDFGKSLLESAGIGGSFKDQSISKFIHGRLIAPPKGLIEGLAASYKLDVAELQRLSRQTVSAAKTSGTSPSAATEAVTLRFFVGHTVWAASFVSAMLDPLPGHPEGVQFASFRDKEGDPIWIKSGEQATNVPHPGASCNFQALSANDVMEEMESSRDGKYGRDVIFGLVPGELVEDRGGSNGTYIKLATLIDSVAACMIVVPKNAPIEPNAGLGTNIVRCEDIAHWLAGQEGRHKIVAEQGTVAWMRASTIGRLANQKRHDSVTPPEHRFTRDLCEITLDDLDAPCVVAWDPQASWLTENSEGKAKKFILLDPQGEPDVPEHLTFNLCFFIPAGWSNDSDRADWRRNVTAACVRLLWEILPSIQRQSSIMHKLDRQDPRILERLSKYFGFDERYEKSETAQIFQSMRYVTSIDPIGLTQALKLGQQ